MISEIRILLLKTITIVFQLFLSLMWNVTLNYENITIIGKSVRKNKAQKDQRIVIECVYVKIRMKMTHLGFELSSIICISILNSYSNFPMNFLIWIHSNFVVFYVSDEMICYLPLLFRGHIRAHLNASSAANRCLEITQRRAKSIFNNT